MRLLVEIVSKLKQQCHVFLLSNVYWSLLLILILLLCLKASFISWEFHNYPCMFYRFKNATSKQLAAEEKVSNLYFITLIKSGIHIKMCLWLAIQNFFFWHILFIKQMFQSQHWCVLFIYQSFIFTVAFPCLCKCIIRNMLSWATGCWQCFNFLNICIIVW